jgi:hypothetical protein
MTRLIPCTTVLAFAGFWSGLVAAPPAPDQDAAAKAVSDDVVMRALVDELGRSMTLQLEDLKSPYFVEYAATDLTQHRFEATCGAIVNSDESKSRRLGTSVRVGYYDLDNTNFAGGGPGGGFGGRRGGGGMGALSGMAALPIEDNYAAIRQAAWLATDGAYKNAVETLSRKQSYMEGQQIEDRPNDFARAEAVVFVKPKSALSIDAAGWERTLRSVSARFLKHPHVIDSQVTLTASADNQYLVNSEGTRVRQGTTGFVLAVTAQALAADGTPLAEIVTRYAEAIADLPGEPELNAIVDEMAANLSGRLSAPRLDHYMGPVLFDGAAAPQLFEAMLAPGITGRPEPVGGGRRRFAGVESLDRYLGKRILPASFSVFDDPRIDRVDGEFLAGHYELDDEGVPAQRVDVVVSGRLDGMLMSRTPTSQFEGSNGHGRSAGFGRPQAALGCLFVQSSAGIIDEELRQSLLDAIKDQEVEFGLRIPAVSSGPRGRGLAGSRGFRGRAPGTIAAGSDGESGGATVGDPIAIFKVYPDGREERVRGCEFGSIEVGALKDIIAAGREPVVHNTRCGGGLPASIIAPAVLFEELELFKVEDEPQRLPIVPAPHQRAAAG